MQLKFFYCPHCGKIISIVKDSGVETICCGQPMKPLIPGTTDGAKEKHLPVITADKQKITVTVGETLHPSLPEHYIEWILLQTDIRRSRTACGRGRRNETMRPWLARFQFRPRSPRDRRCSWWQTSRARFV